MSSRLAGAILALLAAALLALSLVGVPWSWWDGHPGVEGRTISAKTVHVGPIGAQGCNTGGDGACTPLELPGAFTATGYAVAGASGLLALAAILLALSTLAGADGRKMIASGVFVLAGLTAVVALALIVQGPKVKASQHVAIPIGPGMFVFWGGVVTAIVGAVLARRPFPKVALRPARHAAPPAQQPVDMLALLQEDGLRPAAQPQPQSASSSQPLFNSAPQLRALYDADPHVGGTGGYVPGAPAPLPMQAPTPIPRAQVSAQTGIPTPPPLEVPPPLPPRTKPISAPPPRPPPMVADGPRTKAMSAPPPPTAPPPPQRARPGTVPPPPGAIAARLKASSVPAPVRPASQIVPTAAPPKAAPPAAPTAVPTTPKTLAGAAPPKPSSPKLPVRAETDPSEHFETVERAKEPAPADVGDSTDASVVLPPGADVEPTGAREPLDTEEGPVVRPESEADFLETNAVPKTGPEQIDQIVRESQAEIATTARERASAPVIPSAAPAPEPEPPKIPISTAPDSLPPPTEKQAATSGPTPACPQCEAPMAWVEEHLRFYCKSCRMYF